jgi:hypothetical protein
VRPKTIVYFERIMFGTLLLGVFRISSVGIGQSRRPRRHIVAWRLLSSSC